jgi:hypothetical protein
MLINALDIVSEPSLRLHPAGATAIFVTIMRRQMELEELVYHA